MKITILCFILIIGVAIFLSGCCCCCTNRPLFATTTPTPLPSATQMPTPVQTATPQPTVAPYPTYTATPSPAPAGYVASYQVVLAAQTEGNNTIRITNIGGPGTKYLRYFKITDNGVPVDPVGLTTQSGSSGVYTSNAATDRIVVNGYFVDDTQQPLMDTTLFRK